jgi:large subunit ribosomal protein L25
VLLHLRDAVLVRAKPDELPSAIELDITPLDTFDAVLHARDLRMPPGVTLVTDPGEAIARVQPPRIEEVFAPPPAEEEVAEEAEAAAEAAEAGGTAESGEGPAQE